MASGLKALANALPATYACDALDRLAQHGALGSRGAADLAVVIALTTLGLGLAAATLRRRTTRTPRRRGPASGRPNRRRPSRVSRSHGRGVSAPAPMTVASDEIQSSGGARSECASAPAFVARQQRRAHCSYPWWLSCESLEWRPRLGSSGCRRCARRRELGSVVFEFRRVGRSRSVRR